jgi:hypothetical protein
MSLKDFIEEYKNNQKNINRTQIKNPRRQNQLNEPREENNKLENENKEIIFLKKTDI